MMMNLLLFQFGVARKYSFTGTVIAPPKKSSKRMLVMLSLAKNQWCPSGQSGITGCL